MNSYFSIKINTRDREYNARGVARDVNLMFVTVNEQKRHLRFDLVYYIVIFEASCFEDLSLRGPVMSFLSISTVF